MNFPDDAQSSDEEFGGNPPEYTDYDDSSIPGFYSNTRLGADALDLDEPAIDEDEIDEDAGYSYRGTTSDPIFGFLVALAISIGLTPILPANADLRYTLAWGALAGVGVLSWLLGNTDRIAQEKPENIFWGVTFGILLGAPFLAFGGDILQKSSRLIFPEMTIGTLLAYVLFVIPLAETLFFRGVLQKSMEFYTVGALSGLWSILLFFPVMWADILAAPIVAVIIAVALMSMNLMYSYVRDRNGLAAAWICQIVTLLLMVFIPFI